MAKSVEERKEDLKVEVGTKLEGIDFARVLKDFEGKPLCLDEKNPKDLTLREVCIKALTSHTTQQRSGQQEFDHYMLAQRIHEHDKLVLRSEDVTVLKDAIASCPVFLGIVKGQAWGMIDPALVHKDNGQEDG